MRAISGMVTRSTARQRVTEMNSQSLGPLAETLRSAKGAVAASGISCMHSVSSLTRWQRRPLPMMREVSTPPLRSAGASGQSQEQTLQELHPHPQLLQAVLLPATALQPQPSPQEPQELQPQEPQPFWQVPQPFT